MDLWDGIGYHRYSKRTFGAIKNTHTQKSRKVKLQKISLSARGRRWTQAGRLMYEEKTGIRACRPLAYLIFVILCAGAVNTRVSMLVQ